MRRFSGMLLRTIAEQREGGDDELVDPATVDISEIPRLTWNFRSDLPQAGFITRVWLHEGRLYLAGNLSEGPIDSGHLTPAVGLLLSEGKCILQQVGMVHANRDAGLPPVALEDE
jgi:hypothetical protein